MVAVAQMPLTDEVGSNRRSRLRELDWLLNELEEACERGSREVSMDQASDARSRAGVTSGLAIGDAIDCVFREQELTLKATRVLPDRLSKPIGEGGELVAPHITLGCDEAHALTERIRGGLGEVSLLLLEAHDRQAWRVLGYPSWAKYVVGIRIQPKPELRTTAAKRGVNCISGRRDCGNPREITAYSACQIKPLLPDAIAEIQHRVIRGNSEAQARESPMT